MGFSPPGSSVHKILQARILEWVPIPFSRGSSQSRDRTGVSHTAGRFFTMWAIGEALKLWGNKEPGWVPGGRCAEGDEDQPRVTRMNKTSSRKYQPVKGRRETSTENHYKDVMPRNQGLWCQLKQRSQIIWRLKWPAMSWPWKELCSFCRGFGKKWKVKKAKFQHTVGADKYCLIPLIQGTQKSQIHRARKYIGRCMAGQEGELVFNGDRASV